MEGSMRARLTILAMATVLCVPQLHAGDGIWTEVPGLADAWEMVVCDGTVWAATGAGLFRSEDLPASWCLVREGTFMTVACDGDTVLALVVPPRLKSIGDQLIRAAASVPANLAEGAGRNGRDRLHHWRIAYGSAQEAESRLRLLLVANAVDPARTTEALELLDRTCAPTWRLIHPRR